MSMNATEMYIEMCRAISFNNYERPTTDATSPLQAPALEAAPGQSFALHAPEHNLVVCRPVDPRWAVANVLHFFAETEEAGMLRQYNRNADKFLTGDTLEGAYGPQAMPQIRRCIELLREHPNSRRAVVVMDPLKERTINSPACITAMHFLNGRDGLHLLVYQRSLRMAVMPYDCVLLTTLLSYVARRLNVKATVLRWVVGSLHMLPVDEPMRADRSWLTGLPFPPNVLSSPEYCLKELEDGLPNFTE